MLGRTFAALGIVLGLAACAAPAGPTASSGESDAARVTGTITSREPITLPLDAVVAVQLVDVSRVDAPAVVLSRLERAGFGSLPIAFELPYDPARIDSRHRYAVQVRIEQDDTLLFLNDNRHSVLTNGHPSDVEVVVIPAKQR